MSLVFTQCFFILCEVIKNEKMHAQPDRQGEPGRSGGMEYSVLLMDEHSSGAGDLSTSSMTRRAGDSGCCTHAFRLLQTRPELPIPGIGPRSSDPDHDWMGLRWSRRDVRPSRSGLRVASENRQSDP